MATIHVDIVSAEGEIYSGDASMVFAPAIMGEVGIAPRHAPLLTGLRPGEVRVQDPEGEEHFFYISGIVSPEDIDGDGVVSSARLADAQIEFTGRGTLTAAASKGWGSRFLDWIWPF